MRTIAFLPIIREHLNRLRWPLRRAHLPGRTRLREFATAPATTVRSWASVQSRDAGLIEDDRRLIGLLMIRDESDVLDDMLACATRWFDRIFVLDGTTDAAASVRTHEILDRYSEVVYRLADADLGHPVRDGARQYLLKASRERYGVGHWIGVLHADEFLDQDPRPMLACRHPARDPSIRVRLAHTFLHTDDKASWQVRSSLPLRLRVTHMMWPGVPESRFFYDSGDRDYDVLHHGKVIPTSFRNGPLIDGYVITQYNERSPELVSARAVQRMKSGWQQEHYGRFTSGSDHVFTDTLDLPGSRFAPEFRGDPEGPFTPVRRSAIPTGPLDTTQPPVLFSSPAQLSSDVSCVDLSYVTDHGGLLEVLKEPHRGKVRRWAVRMRGDWRRAATGGSDLRGYEALLRHTEAVLRSSRATSSQRARVAAELIARLHDRTALQTGWTTVVPQDQVEAVRRLVSNVV